MITPFFRIQNKDKPHFHSMGSDGVKNMTVRENSLKKSGDPGGPSILQAFLGQGPLGPLKNQKKY